MSTLADIKIAVDRLSREEQALLWQYLSQSLAHVPSCFDLARDIFEDGEKLGSSGLSDLSTNKRHLTSFGRKLKIPPDFQSSS
jgi:hypothetical protein